MNWKFWKQYTLSQKSKLGPMEITYTVTARSKEEARELIKQMQGDSS